MSVGKGTECQDGRWSRLAASAILSDLPLLFSYFFPQSQHFIDRHQSRLVDSPRDVTRGTAVPRTSADPHPAFLSLGAFARPGSGKCS